MPLGSCEHICLSCCCQSSSTSGCAPRLPYLTALVALSFKADTHTCTKADTHLYLRFIFSRHYFSTKLGKRKSKKSKKVSYKKRARGSVHLHPWLRALQPYGRICLMVWIFSWTYRATSRLQNASSRRPKTKKHKWQWRKPRKHP